LIEFKPKNRQTDLTKALKYLQNMMKKQAIVFILSDFMADDYEHVLKITGNKHDVTGIRIYDRREREIPNLGMVQMVDAESGERLLVNTGSSRVRKNYAVQYQKRVDYFQDVFNRSRAGALSLQVGESYVKKLLGYFKRR